MAPTLHYRTREGVMGFSCLDTCQHRSSVSSGQQQSDLTGAQQRVAGVSLTKSAAIAGHERSQP